MSSSKASGCLLPDALFVDESIRTSVLEDGSPAATNSLLAKLQSQQHHLCRQFQEWMAKLQDNHDRLEALMLVDSPQGVSNNAGNPKTPGSRISKVRQEDMALRRNFSVDSAQAVQGRQRRSSNKVRTRKFSLSSLRASKDSGVAAVGLEREVEVGAEADNTIALDGSNGAASSQKGDFQAMTERKKSAVLSVQQGEDALLHVAKVKAGNRRKAKETGCETEVNTGTQSSLACEMKEDEDVTETASMRRPGVTHFVKQWCRIQKSERLKPSNLLRRNSHEAVGGPLQTLVTSKQYEFLVIGMIFVNAALIGAEVEYDAIVQEKDAAHGYQSQSAQSLFFRVSEIIFCVLFTSELLLRMYAQRSAFFHITDRNGGTSSDGPWNCFDTLVVTMMLVDIVWSEVSTNASETLRSVAMLRLIRIMRLLRVVRIIRVLKFFRELRMMLNSIFGCFKSLVWSVLIMAMMFYVFGIVLTQAATNYLSNTTSWLDADTQFLRKHFGTLGRSILSLYESMCGGISWGELYDALGELPAIFSFIFIIFISLAIFAVVNVVTGVFLESALQVSQQDKDALIQEEMRQKEAYAKHVQTIFEEIALQGGESSEINIEMFNEAMKDERMVAFFTALQLDASDVQTLFVLLDRDQTGTININDFMHGCIRLKGQASSLELAKLSYQVEFVIHQVCLISQAMQDAIPDFQLQSVEPSELHPTRLQTPCTLSPDFNETVQQI